MADSISKVGLRKTARSGGIRYPFRLTLGHYSAGFTLDTYAYATQRMKREAADTIGSVI